MEFSPRVIKIERALAAALLIATAVVWRLESSTPVAASLRRGAPWLCHLTLRESGINDQRFLVVYQPLGRVLDIVLTPRAEEAAGAASYEETFFAAAETEPPLQAKEWLLRQTRGLSFWARRPAAKTNLSRFDLLRLGLELRALPVDNIRPAYLPQDASQKAQFMERLLRPRENAPLDHQNSSVTIEVLNATGQKGVALEATKVLRLRGADVVSVGNFAPSARTVIYDRTGRFQNAVWVRDQLGCPQAAMMTQVDAKKLVDVTVALAADCRLR